MTRKLTELTIDFQANVTLHLSENFDYEEALDLANDNTMGQFDYAQYFEELEYEDQLEVLRIWAAENAVPDTYYQDYSGKRSIISFGGYGIDGVDRFGFEVYEIDWENQPGLEEPNE